MLKPNLPILLLMGVLISGCDKPQATPNITPQTEVSPETKTQGNLADSPYIYSDQEVRDSFIVEQNPLALLTNTMPDGSINPDAMTHAFKNDPYFSPNVPKNSQRLNNP